MATKERLPEIHWRDRPFIIATSLEERYNISRKRSGTPEFAHTRKKFNGAWYYWITASDDRRKLGGLAGAFRTLGYNVRVIGVDIYARRMKRRELAIDRKITASRLK